MSAVATRADAVESVLIQGDLSNLTADQRTAYMMRVCESLSLNPLTKPFEFVKLSGRLVMYARKDCTEQLRRRDAVSVSIAARELVGGVYVVTARASLPTGRTDESIGAVPVQGLQGEALANAYMKAETKAKRRVTLSICGLGLLDETEVDSIPGAARVAQEPLPPTPALPAAKPPTQKEITSDALAQLIIEVAELEGVPEEDVRQRMFRALNSDAVCYDDLTTKQLAGAVVAARKKVAELRAAGTLPGTGGAAEPDPADAIRH